MIKFPNSCGILGFCILILHVPVAQSRETLIKANVDARTEYNDNIFLTNAPHDAVTSIRVTPTLEALIRERHWNAGFKAKIRSNQYSDHTLDGNDQFYSFSGQYNAVRNIFSLSARFDLDSNLNAATDEFGVFGRRINKQTESITPSYTRLLTERLVLSISYSYTDVAYLEAENTGFVPFITNSGNFSLTYNLTEKDILTFSLQAVDYKGETIETTTVQSNQTSYKLFTPRLGIEHDFSETLTLDFSAGVSRQKSTSSISQTIDFLGNPVDVPLSNNVKNRGLVLNLGLTKLLEEGDINGRISRDNTTNSVGGINRVDRVRISHKKNISALWNYTVKGDFSKVESIGSGSSVTNRDTLTFEGIIYYSLTENWRANASYRFIQRKFSDDTSDATAPKSNRIYLGLTYNFPEYSTF